MIAWQARPTTGHSASSGSCHRSVSKPATSAPIWRDTQHQSPYQAKADAEGWLGIERALITSDTWIAPKLRRAAADAATEAAALATFGAYGKAWVEGRDLKPRTRSHYNKLLAGPLAPWAAAPLTEIRAEGVRQWYADLGPTRPTVRAHAYGLLRAVLATAVGDGIIAANPCHIRGAGASKRRHQIKPASLPELEALVKAMKPERLQLMVLLAAWCALRFGELTELRRGDIDLTVGVIHVTRAVVRDEGQIIIGTPKSDAGTRDVAIPPHLLPAVKAHLRDGIAGGKNGLLFPAADGVSHMAPSTLYKSFYRARDAAGRPDLRFHDLRHTGAVLAAQTGATLKELMSRLGHSTPSAAMRYQHAAQDRDMQIAAALSAMVKVKP